MSRRTFRLFWKLHGVRYVGFTLCWLVLFPGVVMRRLPAAWPEWVGWLVTLAAIISFLGLGLMMQIISARRITGFPSMQLLWEFWEIDRSYRKLPRAVQQVAFKRHFGRLTPMEVDEICREGVEGKLRS